MDRQRRLGAELFGTFWLVLGGCGTAVLAAEGVGTLGVALAFGLTVLTMSYAVGHISGGHFNPAVTVGLVVSGRHARKDLVPYVVSQLVGAFLAAGVLFVVANGLDTFSIDSSAPGAFAANGYGDLSPNGYTLASAFVIEVVLTAFFLLVILGATAKKAAAGLGGVAIGLALTLIHLISIPVTNTSVNPARSTSQAVFAGGDYVPQLWLFWLAPILGGAIGAVIWKLLLADGADEVALADGVEEPGNP